VPQNFALWERMALIAQRDLAQIGVDMQLESVPFSTFNERIGKSDFDAVVMELVAGNSVSRPYFFWHSRGLLNAWGYSNRKVDDALDGIRRARDDKAYREAFHSFQVESIEDPPAVFLALGEVTRAVSNRFYVAAQPGSDIIATIPEWRLSADNKETN
jgi:ABC-type transport system substrate-binding protein